MSAICTIPIRPLTWWRVIGRKLLGREGPSIRNAWQVGRYAEPGWPHGRDCAIPDCPQCGGAELYAKPHIGWDRT